MNTEPRTDPGSQRRLAILVGLVLGGLSLAFLFPDGSRMRESAITMSLPERIDAWKGSIRPPSLEEGKLLAPTRDSRKWITPSFIRCGTRP